MTRRILRALGLAAATVALSVSVHAEAVVQTFDEVSAPGPIAFVVPGFANGPSLDYDRVSLRGGVIITDDLFGNEATSGNNILASCDTCMLGDGSGLPGFISGSFTADVESMGCDVYNGLAATGTYTLTAKDGNGDVIATDSVVVGPFGGPNFHKTLVVSAPGIRSFTITTNLDGFTFAIDTLTFAVSEGSFTDLGHGLAGALGEPALTGTGTLIGGDPVSLDLTGAAPAASAVLFVGFTELNFPFFYGGTLVPDPTAPALLLVLVTDGSGGVSLPGTWPDGLPSGFELYLQTWIVDASGPFGFTASNGLRGTTP